MSDRRPDPMVIIAAVLIVFGAMNFLKNISGAVFTFCNFALATNIIGISLTIFELIYPFIYLLLMAGGALYFISKKPGLFIIRLGLLTDILIRVVGIINLLAAGARVFDLAMLPIYLILLSEVILLYVVERETQGAGA